MSLLKKKFAFVGLLATLALGFANIAAVSDTSSSNAKIEFTAGELTLVTVPDFDFGQHVIPGVTTDYQAVAISVPVQVSDLRGAITGWSVKAELSGFTTGGANTLAGATMTLNNGTTTTAGGTTGTAPSVPAAVTIPSDGTSVNIAQAAIGTGGGIWDISWPKADTSIKIFGGTARTGVSNATLTWSLEDTP